MLVREFMEADRDRLHRIYLDSRRATFHWLDTSAYKLEDFDTDTQGEKLLVAVNDKDEALGFVSIWVPDNFIHNLFIIPGLERQGIGMALLNAATDLFDLPLTLKCMERNHNAINFYKANGWRIKGKGSDENGDYYVMISR
jgi:GNAT superfamily N-acetyltransferase